MMRVLVAVALGATANAYTVTQTVTVTETFIGTPTETTLSPWDWEPQAGTEASAALTEPVAKGATILPVKDATGFKLGRKVLIAGGTPQEEVNEVAAFGSIVLKSPLQNAHAAGVTITMPKEGALAFSASGFLNEGTFASDSLGSENSVGSKASGSFGFVLQIWEWCLVPALALCLLCVCAVCKGKKSKKTKKKALPAPEPEPLVEEEPLLPPLIPLATTSQFMPSYSMMASPMTASYAAPMTTAYAAPMTQQYASYSNLQPAQGYAGYGGYAAGSYAQPYGGAVV